MLEQFGLSNYENKSYLALLRMGMADARSISTESEVPYGRIYDTLDGLKSKGIINEIPGRPKQYTVVEPDIALKNLIREKQLEMRELEKQAEIAAQNLNNIYEQKPEDKLVWKAAIGEDLYLTYFDLLAEARREFLAYIEIFDAGFQEENFREYLELFRLMKRNKINIQIIIGIDDIGRLEEAVEENPELLQIVDLGEIKYTTKKHQGFTIIDREKVIIKVANPMNGEEMLAAIYLWQKNLGSTLRKSFFELWEAADPLKFTLSANME